LGVPLPTVDSVLHKLGHGKIFTQLDLRAAFHQLEVAEESRQYLSFASDADMFSFYRAPFGVKTISAIFQQLMDQMMGGIEDSAVYIDNIVVGSAGVEEHWRAVAKVLETANRWNLKLNPDKCEFGRAELTVLGVRIKAGVMSIDPEKAKRVRETALPTTVNLLQRFLGLVNYVRPFLPHLATLATPLTAMATGVGTKVLEWSVAATRAFERVKEAVCEAVELTFPDDEALLIMYTDASAFGAGAVLGVLRSVEGATVKSIEELEGGKAVKHGQRGAGDIDPDGFHFRPIAFFSKRFRDYEFRWNVTRKELAALVWALRFFHYYIAARRIVLRTDHNSLLFSVYSEAGTATVQHWLPILGTYDYKIQHVSGTVNVLADALSRSPPRGKQEAVVSGADEVKEARPVNALVLAAIGDAGEARAMAAIGDPGDTRMPTDNDTRRARIGCPPPAAGMGHGSKRSPAQREPCALAPVYLKQLTHLRLS